MINHLTLSGVSKDQRYTGDLMIPQSLSFLVRSLYLLIYIVESLWLLCTNKVYLALLSEFSIKERQKNTKKDKFTQIMHEIYVTVQITRFCSPGIMTKELSKLVNIDGNRCPHPPRTFSGSSSRKEIQIILS